MSEKLAGLLNQFGLSQPKAIAVGEDAIAGQGEVLEVTTPVDGSSLASFAMASPDQVGSVIERAQQAFLSWRTTPAPVRGELIRRFGETLREYKSQLAELVTWECGKIFQEALGEVQEMIDICDFAVGLSRQLYGLTIASERPGHRLMEQWHPLGPVGIISAFNFPVAVWSWNAALAVVCGNPIIWKPSEKTPLTALASHQLLVRAARSMSDIPEGLSQVVVGGADVGQTLASDSRLPLISATGSVPMGRAVAQTVAARLGRTLLELGGNNAAIVTPTADLPLAIRGIVFAAVGTCGQRCTSLRRLIVHESLHANVCEQLRTMYKRLPIGDPFAEGTLVGPLIDEPSFARMQEALKEAKTQGGKIEGGERIHADVPGGGVYVQPALVEIEPSANILQQETFAPILYVMKYRDFEQAIAIQNGVPQGLSSAVFTNDVREAELFCSPSGSDCGIANVNIGTSGAEIGGAFGGEKETGGGRESGSDAWKNYMRRATNTINYSTELPLAQGIRFEFD